MSPPKTTIILVRHADVHNPNDIVYGRLPRFRLSALGEAEARRTAEALCAAPPAALYSSPQLRARQTARIIAAQYPGLEIHVTRLLAEVLTSWQGRPNAEMAVRQFNFYDPLHHPDDESLEDIAHRLVRWIALMLRRHPGAVVAGVSHGDPLMVVRLLFSGQALTPANLRRPEEYPAKGSITRLVFEGVGDPTTLPVQVRYEDPNQAARGGPQGAQRVARAGAVARRES
jgi:broad specificity phosphatase PhoE